MARKVNINDLAMLVLQLVIWSRFFARISFAEEHPALTNKARRPNRLRPIGQKSASMSRRLIRALLPIRQMRGRHSVGAEVSL
jgi:hypothetical protein